MASSIQLPLLQLSKEKTNQHFQSNKFQQTESINSSKKRLLRTNRYSRVSLSILQNIIKAAFQGSRYPTLIVRTKFSLANVPNMVTFVQLPLLQLSNEKTNEHFERNKREKTGTINSSKNSLLRTNRYSRVAINVAEYHIETAFHGSKGRTLMSRAKCPFRSESKNGQFRPWSFLRKSDARRVTWMLSLRSGCTRFAVHVMHVTAT